MERQAETATQAAARIMRAPSPVALADYEGDQAKNSGDANLIAHARNVRTIVRRHHRMNRIGSLLETVGAAILLTGVCALALQSFLWLRYGRWVELPLLGTLHEAGLISGETVVSISETIGSIEWQGVKKSVAWLFMQVATLPLSGTLIVLGIAFLWWGFRIARRNRRLWAAES
jgi:hypothetical protein